VSINVSFMPHGWPSDSDVNKDWTHKDQDKDQSHKDKDKDKD